MRYIIDCKAGGALVATFETGDVESALGHFAQSLIDVGIGEHRAVAAAKIALDRGSAVYFNENLTESVEFTITQ